MTRVMICAPRHHEIGQRTSRKRVWSTVMSEGSLTSVETRQNLSRLIPPEIADILGHPPVLSTENRQAYDALMTQLVLEWKPRNIIGWTFVDDLANISLEIFRHRRAIANLFAISFKTALKAVL